MARAIRGTRACMTATLIVGACSIIGPTEIITSRGVYNSVIQETTKQQMFMNIVRVSQHEPTLFMDVTEVDAAMSAQAAFSAAKTGIGSHHGTTGATLAGAVGAITGSMVAQESPTVRYQPLQGQPLVQQIGSPITVDSIGKLYDSEWRIGVILGLAVDRITQSFVDSPAIIGAIDALDDYGVIGLVAARSTPEGGETQAAPPGKKVSTDLGTITIATKQGSGGDSSSSAKESDTLAVYLRKGHPLLYRYETLASETAQIDLFWQRLRSLYGTVATGKDKSSGSGPEMILIRTVPSPLRMRKDATEEGKPGGARNGKQVGKNDVTENGATLEEPPAMRTHSAIGILKVAFESPKGIEIMSHARYEAVRNAPWNRLEKAECFNAEWYTLLPRICQEQRSAEDAPACELPKDSFYEDTSDSPALDRDGRIYRASSIIYSFIKNSEKMSNHAFRCLYTASMFSDMKNYDEILNEYRLSTLRRYVLIIKEPSCPADTYVSYSDDTGCYYIDPTDDISKKNFILITLFLTMQAVPPTSAPLTPTISVGGQGGG